MKTKGGLPIVTIVIIAVVVMLIATAVIFFAFEEWGEDWKRKYGKCGDVDYYKEEAHNRIAWIDSNDQYKWIIYYPYGISGARPDFKWQFADGSGYTSYYSPYDVSSLTKLITRVTNDYNNGLVTKDGYHWFKCMLEVVD